MEMGVEWPILILGNSCRLGQALVRGIGFVCGINAIVWLMAAVIESGYLG